MRAHVTWTPELDARLKDLRSAGLTWDAMAAAMSLGRNTVLERGRKLGINKRRGVVVPAVPTVSEPEQNRHDRGALPPGHSLTWGVINAGTLLQDAEYPFPVFM